MNNSNIAVFPGSFDPITFGHLDVIKRGSKLFDTLIVGIGINSEKKSIFTTEERIEMTAKLTENLGNVKVEAFSCMTVDFVQQIGAKAILRGIRTYADFEYEFQLAIANRRMGGVETLFVMASAENSFISSTLIREACSYGGDISAFVPNEIAVTLQERIPIKPHGGKIGLGGAEAPQAGHGKNGLIGEIIE